MRSKIYETLGGSRERLRSPSQGGLGSPEKSKKRK
nr:MAG TPA: hypothetical protein [Caudoviricetes sp.]